MSRLWLIPRPGSGAGPRRVTLPVADAVAAMQPGDGLVIESPRGPTRALFILAAVTAAGRYVVAARLEEDSPGAFLRDPAEPGGWTEASVSGETLRPFPRQQPCGRAVLERAAAAMVSTGELDG